MLYNRMGGGGNCVSMQIKRTVYPSPFGGRVTETFLSFACLLIFYLIPPPLFSISFPHVAESSRELSRRRFRSFLGWCGEEEALALALVVVKRRKRSLWRGKVDVGSARGATAKQKQKQKQGGTDRDSSSTVQKPATAGNSYFLVSFSFIKIARRRC